MATTTPNLGLTKPEVADMVNVSDLNENADLLDAIIGKMSDLNTEQKDSLVEAINEAARTGGGGGLNSTASTLLITILRNGAYTEDQSANITALEAALASGGSDEPDTPEPPASDVEQNGTILSIVSGVTVSQTGSVLAIA